MTQAFDRRLWKSLDRLAGSVAERLAEIKRASFPVGLSRSKHPDFLPAPRRFVVPDNATPALVAASDMQPDAEAGPLVCRSGATADYSMPMMAM